MPSLTRADAAERAALLTVESYEIDLDFTGALDGAGEAGFRSAVTIRFRAAAGAATFVEVKPVQLLGVRLNGVELDPAALDDNRFPLTGLRDENVLVVEARMAYSNTGEGMHRFVDPADGETYLYAMSFLDEVQRIYAAFDQPDLKAPVTLAVTAPPHWIVAGNGEQEPGSGNGEQEVTSAGGERQPAVGAGGARARRWRFRPTRPLATYFTSLIAGPYHLRRSEHDGIPLGLYCRRSLAEHLDADADELFTVTRQCLDRFHELFGVRYPFGKYDQAFVPEFNAGAMENPGLVTLRDDYVFRSAVTESQREQRATTIAHEMAHMWFGDLVTMRWWDDLWLNESFAEYLGTRVTAEATRHRHAWTTFAMRRKAWGYAADQRPSTHPVAPPEVTDAAQALVNFDGISYAKGASVLRQLVAWIGDEPFLAGLRAHFAAHRFGNATLADLLAALSSATGRDLAGWAELWLRRARVNTLRAEVTVADDGRYAEVAVVQTAPPEQPVLRPHRIGVAGYDLDESAGGRAVPRQRFEADLEPGADGERTVLAALAGVPAADVLLLNDGDLTFAKVRLDPASTAAVPRVLPALTDPLARALLWRETLDAVTDAERPVADLVGLVLTALPAEREVIVVEDVLGLGGSLIDRYLDAPARAEALRQVAHACERLLAATPASDDPESRSLRLAAVRGLIAAGDDTDRLGGWLAGHAVPEGIAVDAELRWAVLNRLAVLGAVGAPEIDAELAADRSAAGAERAAQCRAALPDPAAKRRAWEAVVSDTTLSNRLVRATAAGFWQPEQRDLTEPYVERYFAEMPAAARLRTPFLAERVAGLAFPRYAVAPRTSELATALLERDDLVQGLRRAVTDAADDLRRALAARARFR
ncbi:aminopeptidase N [Micromonospora sp. NPDC049559]|uniref:aminopeptidase N n=1 Tax=Micromonospora sp. NPDC049559 TaxID=3155923 RepID=UPI00342CBAC7